MHDCIVVHYGEIGIKGNNRGFFENRLVANIRKVINAEIEREYGRIVITETPENLEALKDVFGIAFFSPALRAGLDIESIKEKALQLAKEKHGRTFAIAAKRSNKSFEYNSKQINEIAGRHIADSTGMKVNLDNPDMRIFIEAGHKSAYVYTEKINGLGGLPVGVSGKVVCLLSGGIDSPVASHMMMKRGCKVVFVHFHNYTSRIEEKIEKIVGVLNKYQHSSKVYMVPFFPIQEKIIEKVPESHRMIVYRRMMMRIAERIMQKEGAKAITTGDSIAQVASQTLDNLHAIHSSASAAVFSPVIGMDKNEIIAIAKKIGTYELSILPYMDCCAYMIAKHPETRANLKEIEEMESALDIENLVSYGVEKSEVKVINAANSFQH